MYTHPSHTTNLVEVAFLDVVNDIIRNEIFDTLPTAKAASTLRQSHIILATSYVLFSYVALATKVLQVQSQLVSYFSTYNNIFFQ